MLKLNRAEQEVLVTLLSKSQHKNYHLSQWDIRLCLYKDNKSDNILCYIQQDILFHHGW